MALLWKGKTMSHQDWTLDQFAQHYAETIMSPANAWGQHVSDLFGQSHHIMIAATAIYGSETVHEAFNKAVREAENDLLDNFNYVGSRHHY